MAGFFGQAYALLGKPPFLGKVTIDILPTESTLIDAVNKFDNVIAEEQVGSVNPLFKGFCSAAF